jgi:hypothetical protein
VTAAEPETTNSPHEWALSRIRDRTDADPDGRQDVQSNVWTSTQRLKGDASKTDVLERGDVAGVIESLRQAGEIVTWHGLIAPADEGHLIAIIKNERESGAPRRILNQRVNGLLRGDDSE